jgi:hypothetical protein
MNTDKHGWGEATGKNSGAIPKAPFGLHKFELVSGPLSVSIGVHLWLKFFAPPRLCVETNQRPPRGCVNGWYCSSLTFSIQSGVVLNFIHSGSGLNVTHALSGGHGVEH